MSVVSIFMRLVAGVVLVLAVVSCSSPGGGVVPAGEVRWTRQFGTGESDVAEGVAADGAGRVYVAGFTAGALEGADAGGGDAFVRSYDADGELRWTRQFGTSSAETAKGVAVDGAGRVFVAGYTEGGLEGVNAGAFDGFVRSYDSSGGVRWTRQFGSASGDYVLSVAVDGAGRVFVAGYTEGGLEGGSLGGADAFVRSYDADGGLRWTRQFGTNSADFARGVAVGGDGRVYVVGYTAGDLDGRTVGLYDAFIRSYNAAGDLRWTRQFGTGGHDFASGVAVDETGRVYLAGYTGGGLEGASAGGNDAFVRSYDADGDLRWTRQFGTSGTDAALVAAVDGLGRVAVAGFTDGGLDGGSAGEYDAFVRSYDVDGGARWARQFGTSSDDQPFAVAVDTGGRLYVGGFTAGALTGASAGGNDAFLRSYGP